ncbi:cell wall-binding repeat-containing protein [Clostridium sp. CX1]|uniref:cell wall-binding repeat-containing protein n=1 Tax=Clostridium sp. CX1 TaxID=2978346 RepID=UPI0021C12AB0|nr:cell wall-binding repeat-containing protein [Clostridium sp. CX1]MCT8978331.1 cell wall-binding repeat-containing protein [Clostridium sp. CX1]
MIKKKYKNTIMLITLLPAMLCFKVEAKSEIQSTATRIWGKDRYETAIEISKVGWKMGANSAVIVSGEDFADGLSAAPFAKIKDAPIIFTNRDNLDDKTIEELKRLKVTYVYIIGGEGVISKTVENTIKSELAITTDRIWGEDRYETAAKVAERLDNAREIFIASGEDYADALSIGAIAAMKEAPIILVSKDKLPKCSKEYIYENYDNINKSYIIGGTAAVGKDIELELKNSERIGGLDRYETNREVLKGFATELDYKKVYLARGDQFSDALTSSVMAAKEKAAVVLMDKDESSRNFVKPRLSPRSTISVIGGSSNISDSTVNELRITAECFDSVSEISNREIHNNVAILREGTVLKDLRIKGNLYIESPDVVLNNVIVDGTIYINSIGYSSTKLNNVIYDNLVENIIKIEDSSSQKNEEVIEKNQQSAHGRPSRNSSSNNSSHNDTPKDDIVKDNPKEEENKDPGNTPEEGTTDSAIDVESIKLLEDTLKLEVGDSLRLAYQISPENASNKNVSLISDNSDIVEVNDDGIIKAKASGEAMVTAITESKGLMAECRVIVDESSEVESLGRCKDKYEIMTFLEENPLHLELDTYGNLVPSAKELVAEAIYENKDQLNTQESLQQEIDELLTKGYIIKGNTATIIEGVGSSVSNAVSNPEICDIYLGRGTYVIDSSINIDRHVSIIGEGEDSSKIQLNMPSTPLVDNKAFRVNKTGVLEIKDLSIDGLYNIGKNITFVIESEGTTILNGVTIENIGDHIYKKTAAIRAIGNSILRINDSVFRNIQNITVAASYESSSYIGTEMSNVFEGGNNEEAVAAIVSQGRGKASIENNVITGYKGKSSCGIKLEIGGLWSVKGNDIRNNSFGIKVKADSSSSGELRKKTSENLKKLNPGCKDNGIDVQVYE